jgi:ribosomal protein S12 methylthiotransferase accessory factor
LYGLFELIERDAVALWWYNRAPRPRVDLRSFGDVSFDEIELHYVSIGLPVYVLDITSDTSVPAFAAVACDQGTRRLAAGFGCHLDARIGVERALTELNQLFSPSRALPTAWDGVSLRQQHFLFPDERLAPRSASDYPAARRGDLRDDVLACVDRLARAGIEPLAIELTRPDIGLSVARVFAPGLRHFWPRLGPGRLYDTPPRLGWLKEPLREDELNPLPIVW